MTLPWNLQRLRVNRNLLVVVGTYFFGGLETSIINVVWQPFVLSLGASMSLLGVLTSIGGYNGIVPTLVSPIGGWFADRRGRKILLLAASASVICAYALYLAAGMTGLVWVLGPGIILAGGAAVARPVASALTGESVRAERQASAYSLVSFANILPGVLAPLAAGWLADRLGYKAIFPLALGAEVASFILVARYLQDKPRNASAGMNWGSLKQLLRRAWLPPRGLEAFFAISAMDSFSWGIGYGLLYGLVSKEYHFDVGQIGIMASAMSLSWAVMQLPVARLIDRFGTKNILAISEALGPPLLWIWMTQTRFEIFVASMAFFSLNAVLWIPARNTFITRSSAPENRAEVFGRLAAFGGLIAFPGPFIGGVLYDHWGYAAPFLANLIGSALTALVIILFVHEPSAEPTVNVGQQL